MGLVGSLIGASIGWWTLGPMGVIMGLVLGHLTEEQASFIKKTTDGASPSDGRSGFLSALLVLVAAVMKADGKVLKSELEYVKKSLVATFGEQQAGQALLMLRDILNQTIPVREVTHQIRVNLNYDSRLQLVHMMFGIALADGVLSEEEKVLVQNISLGLGISSRDFESVSAMFVPKGIDAYKILEVERSATNDEIKKAYKKLVVRYHPDKVAHLGEDIKKQAEEKIKKVNEAYDKVKKERGIK